jgi:hypothetical protein
MAVRISGLLLGAALALTVTAASAAEYTESANYWLPYCHSFLSMHPPGLFSEGICSGTVSGIVFMGAGLSQSKQALPEDVRKEFCIELPPSGVITRGQEVRVVISYIEARPARMHESFHDLALEALRTAWPCK